MSYAAHERNGDLSMQEHAFDNLNPKKRKRDVTDQGVGGSQSGPKRGSTSSMNGTSHDSSNYLDNFHSSSSSNDFSNLSQQLQAATNTNHSLPTSNASSTAAAALAGIMPQMTIPQPTDMSFASITSNTDPDRHFDSSFDISGDSSHGHNGQGPPYNLHPFPGNTAAQVQAARESSNGGGLGHKPSVGSDEWHKLSGGVGKRSTKRAVEYIAQLKNNEEKAIQKYTQDKMLMEGVVNELTTSVDSLKNELDRSTRNAAMWKKIAVEAGLEGKFGNGAAADAEAQGEGGL
ncbi:MAG: hypothetical protein Q9225_007458 [Loekoesia sp. 1 TL-2023]